VKIPATSFAYLLLRGWVEVGNLIPRLITIELFIQLIGEKERGRVFLDRYYKIKTGRQFNKMVVETCADVEEKAPFSVVVDEINKLLRRWEQTKKHILAGHLTAYGWDEHLRNVEGRSIFLRRIKEWLEAGRKNTKEVGVEKIKNDVLHVLDGYL